MDDSYLLVSTVLVQEVVPDSCQKFTLEYPSIEIGLKALSIDYQFHILILVLEEA